MVRKFVDLLTFPLGAGGSDTPCRLALVARRLSYDAIGMIPSAGEGRPACHELPDIGIFPVAEDGSRGARRAELKFSRGKRARRSASAASADFIIPDPRDAITLRFAGENRVPVAYPYAALLQERNARRSTIIGHWARMHEMAVKFGCVELLVSGATSSYLLRDPLDMASFVSSCFGETKEKALEWVSSNPQEVLERAREGG